MCFVDLLVEDLIRAKPNLVEKHTELASFKFEDANFIQFFYSGKEEERNWVNGSYVGRLYFKIGLSEIKLEVEIARLSGKIVWIRTLLNSQKAQTLEVRAFKWLTV